MFIRILEGHRPHDDKALTAHSRVLGDLSTCRWIVVPLARRRSESELEITISMLGLREGGGSIV